jgi:hypothetical protein
VKQPWRVSSLLLTAILQRFIQRGKRTASSAGFNIRDAVSDLSESSVAAPPSRIFGDHPRRLLSQLQRDADLCEAVRCLLDGQPSPTVESFYGLRSAGVLVDESVGEARLRCPPVPPGSDRVVACDTDACMDWEWYYMREIASSARGNEVEAAFHRRFRV